MKHLTRKTLIGAALVGLGVATANLAAAGPYGGRGDCMYGSGMAQQGYQQMEPGAMPYQRGGRHQPMMRQQRMETHLNAVAQALGLSAEQQPAWQKFVESRQARAQEMAARREAMKAQPGQTAQAHMATRVERMEQRLERMKQAQAELDNLYAELTPEQRGIADRMLVPRGGRRAF